MASSKKVPLVIASATENRKQQTGNTCISGTAIDSGNVGVFDRHEFKESILE